MAEDINNADVMVGRYWDSDTFFYGYVRTGNVFNILHVPSSGNTLAEGINDTGKVVGTYGDANGTHGFMYNGGSYSTFDSVGSSETRFTDINNADKIVGRYMDNGIYHSFIYDGAYSMIDVPGATQTWVMKINDFDKIVGIYYDGSGMHSFIGTPVVPEPSTIFLFGSGLIGLISFKREWKRGM
jgi:probable HAF family extracellular repeat protein